MKNLLFLLGMLLIVSTACEKETTNPLIGWWKIQKVESVYYTDSTPDSVKVIDYSADFKHLNFNEDGTGVMYTEGLQDYSFTWNTKNDILSIKSNESNTTVNYEYQVSNNTLEYTRGNNRMEPTAFSSIKYKTTAFRGK